MEDTLIQESTARIGLARPTPDEVYQQEEKGNLLFDELLESLRKDGRIPKRNPLRLASADNSQDVRAAYSSLRDGIRSGARRLQFTSGKAREAAKTISGHPATRGFFGSVVFTCIAFGAFIFAAKKVDWLVACGLGFLISFFLH